MRFSAVQDPCYGGEGLEQSQIPHDNQDVSMSTMEEDQEAPYCGAVVSDESIVSNLPLLFVGGYPSSLETITLPQLEKFIQFMYRCSLGRDSTKTKVRPQWWPENIPVGQRPPDMNDAKWLRKLKQIVLRCYTYHRSEYLLRFCEDLNRYPKDELEFMNNWDTTSSLFHKTTRKLLVTFRNENMTYDKPTERASPRKTLLQHASPNAKTKHYQRQQQQEQHSLVVQFGDDIYLCDNCDAEFEGLSKMKEHEKICIGDDCGTGSRSTTPDYLQPEPQINQDDFLQYFHLGTSQTIQARETRSFALPTCVVDSRPSRRIKGTSNLARCPTIPFSSPAGLLIGKKSKMMTEEIQQERQDRLERYLLAPALSVSKIRPKWLDKTGDDHGRCSVTYKSKTEPNKHVHEYKFSNTDKPVLSIDSQLLYLTCRKPLYVQMERLNDKQVAELKRDPAKYKPPLIEKKHRVKLRKQIVEPARQVLPVKRKADEDVELIILECEDPSEQSSRARILPTLCDNNNTTARTTPYVRRDATVKTDIAFVNLCSSDEEDIQEQENKAVPRLKQADSMTRQKSAQDGESPVRPLNSHNSPTMRHFH